MAFIPHGEPTHLNLKFSLNVSQIIIQTLLNVSVEEECNGIQLCTCKSRGKVVTFLKFNLLECEFSLKHLPLNGGRKLMKCLDLKF